MRIRAKLPTMLIALAILLLAYTTYLTLYFTRMPTAEQSAEAAVRAVSLLALAGVAVIGGIVLAFRRLRKTLNALIKGAEELAYGNLDSQPKWESGISRQTDRLAELLDYIRARLCSEDLHVDKLIDERTRELKQKGIFERSMAEQELDEMNHRLVRAMRARDEFLANMSHEIRTPMNAIVGLNNLVLKTDLTPRQRSYLEKIGTSSRSLLGIINEILDFSKIEAGKLNIEKTGFHLQRILEDLADLFAEQVARKGLELTIVRHPEVPSGLVGDPLRIRQVLVNLISNAVKFTDRGEVNVSVTMLDAAAEPPVMEFSVQDTGIGIRKEDIPMLFQAFRQADSSVTRRYGGTGLGLAISQQLVHLMSGNIKVESELGKGSLFSFTLPLEYQPEAAEPIYRDIEPFQGLPVLVIDRHAATRNMLSDLLAGWSMSVTAVESYDLAIESLKQAAEGNQNYRIVIAEGPEVAFRNRELPQLLADMGGAGNVPALILTIPFGGEYALQEIEDERISAYLIKPVKPSALLEVLRVEMGFSLSVFEPVEGSMLLSSSMAEVFRDKKVLVAEDNAISRDLMVDVLTQGGMSVDAVSSGIDAVEAVKKKHYDLVMMDVQMPVMDGYEATHRIRALGGEAQTLPVIAMTAYALRADQERCLREGMNDYISKPVQYDVLNEKLLTWLRPAGKVAEEARETIDQSAPVPQYVVSDALGFTPVAGFDVDAGVLRVRGNTRLYARLLNEFSRDYVDSVGDIRAAMEAQDRTEATRIVHTLKGTAGNLSATRVAEAAADIHRLLRDPSVSMEDISLRELDHAMAEALNSIQQVESLLRTMEKPVNVKDLEAGSEQIPDIINDLDAFLLANNYAAETEALKLREKLQRIGDSRLLQLQDRLDDAISGFRFVLARRILGELKEEFSPPSSP